MKDVVALVKQLYAVVDQLEDAFPGRHFTPDGHLVGSIGEVLAAHCFDLELLTASTEGHDAVARDGRLVEIKATQGTRSVALQAHGTLPDHLIVMRIDRHSGSVDEVVYNGPAEPAWDLAGKPQKNGQRKLTLSRLRALMGAVPENARLAQVKPLP